MNNEQLKQTKLIVLNITSFAGQCADAVHVYGYLYFIDDNNINIDNVDHYSLTGFKNQELYREITLEESKMLDAKDDDKSHFYEHSWLRGNKLTNRFNSIEEVTKQALEDIKKLGIYCNFISLYESSFNPKLCKKIIVNDSIKQLLCNLQNNLLENSKELPGDFAKVINEKFWDLI